uniref:Uncharacterized protein n=1 Tax=Lepeophtheirus salmonis TaxID=72036 RepID=A0A0K2V7G2_LEPSM
MANTTKVHNSSDALFPNILKTNNTHRHEIY